MTQNAIPKSRYFLGELKNINLKHDFKLLIYTCIMHIKWLEKYNQVIAVGDLKF